MTQLGFFAPAPALPFVLPIAGPDADEIIVDSFAGGGGASEGIRRALGRSPHVAINHKPEMIALHAANHPDTEHHPTDVWKIDPVAVCKGHPVGLMWLSPDCTHFSKAKGTKPLKKKIRGLAWVAIRWVAAVKPRVIILENVEEFEGWGPVLRETQRPCPKRKGQTFKAFVRKLRKYGYAVEWRRLRACDFGAPTTRQRLFLIARCDGEAIVWPDATHGPGRAKPWRTAAECIDWSIPCPSIFLTKHEGKALGFNVKRPLAEKTLRRIARGVYRFVINNPKPFIVEYHSPRRDGDQRARPVTTPARHAGHVEPIQPRRAVRRRRGRSHGGNRPSGASIDRIRRSRFFVPSYGEEPTRNNGAGQPPRVRSVEVPMPTIVPNANGAKLVSAFLAKHFGGHETPGSSPVVPFDTVTSRDHHALVASSLVKLKGTSRDGQPTDEPVHTIQAHGNHYAEVRAFLAAYYSSGSGMTGHAASDPLPSVMPHDRFALVTVAGVDYAIVDIGMRMLQPRELFRAQGFHDSYVIDIEIDGKPITKETQTEMVGNSVSPDNAEALVLANYRPTWARRERAA